MIVKCRSCQWLSVLLAFWIDHTLGSTSTLLGGSRTRGRTLQLPKAGEHCDTQKDRLQLPDIEAKHTGASYIKCVELGPQFIQWQRYACQTGSKFAYNRQSCIPVAPPLDDRNKPPEPVFHRSPSIFETAPGPGGFYSQLDGRFPPPPSNSMPPSNFQQQPAFGSESLFGGFQSNNNYANFYNYSGIAKPVQVAPTFGQPQSGSQPGETCRFGEYCTGGSYCNRDTLTCMCPDGSWERDAVCVYSAKPTVPASKLGEHCFDARDCSENAECIRGTCSCLYPFVQTSDLLCLRQTIQQPKIVLTTTSQPPPSTSSYQSNRVTFSYPGESCFNGEVCSGNSFCSSSTMHCVCAYGAVQVGRSCESSRSSSTQKEADFSGQREPPGSSSRHKIQVMPPRPSTLPPFPTSSARYENQMSQVSVPHAQVTTFEQLMASNYPFSQNQSPQPPPSQSQQQQLPPPPPSFQIHPASAPQRRGAGDSCIRNADCHLGAYCSRNRANSERSVCICLSTHIEVEKRCKPVVYPGQNGCDVSAQCNAVYNGAVCFEGTCKCPAGTSVRGAICEPDIAIPQAQKREPRPGEACYSGESCSDSSVCSNGICRCRDPSMEIVNGHCQTAQPSTPSYPAFANPGAECGPNSKCPGSICINGRCTCRENYELVGQLCARKANNNSHNEPASTTTASTAAKLPTSTRPEVVLAGSLSAGPGGSCSAGQSCTGGSHCNGRQCVCAHGTKQQNGVCQPILTATPFSSCIPETTICTGNSYCDGSICRCPHGTALAGEVCQVIATPASVSTAPIGASCASGEQCLGGSSCIDNYCQCREGTLVSARTQTCEQIKIVNLGDPCRYDQLCIGKGICLNDVCTCPGGLFQEGNHCIAFENSKQFLQKTTVDPRKQNVSTTIASELITRKPTAFPKLAYNKPFSNNFEFVTNEPISLGGACRPFDDCIIGAFCSSRGVCICVPGNVEMNGHCHPEATATTTVTPFPTTTTDRPSGEGSNQKEGSEEPGKSSWNIEARRPIPNSERNTENSAFGADNKIDQQHAPSSSQRLEQNYLAELAARQNSLASQGFAPFQIHQPNVFTPFAQQTSQIIQASIKPEYPQPYFAKPEYPPSPFSSRTDYPLSSYANQNQPFQQSQPQQQQQQQISQNSYQPPQQQQIQQTFSQQQQQQNIRPWQQQQERPPAFQQTFPPVPTTTTKEPQIYPDWFQPARVQQTFPPPPTETTTLPTLPPPPPPLSAQVYPPPPPQPSYPQQQQTVSEIRSSVVVNPLSSSRPYPEIIRKPYQQQVPSSLFSTAKETESPGFGGSTQQQPLPPPAFQPSSPFTDFNQPQQPAPYQRGKPTVSQPFDNNEDKYANGPSSSRSTFVNRGQGFGASEFGSSSSISNKQNAAFATNSLFGENVLPVNELSSKLGAVSKANQEYQVIGGGSSSSTNPPVSSGSTAAASQNTASFSSYQLPAGYAKPGGSCRDGERCTNESYCDTLTQTCVCRSGLFANNGACREASWESSTPPEAGRSKGPAIPSDEAESCPLPESPEKCRLPNCYCSKTGAEIPGNLPLTDTPQFVILNFDDPVNGKSIEVYKEMFDGRHRNKNGCPIKATFFISHEWTNYDDVQWLASTGHEIASNSITHDTLQRSDHNRWKAEIDGMRRILQKFAKVDPKEVIGMRAPQLTLAGDLTFEMMRTSGFAYDNSMMADSGVDSPPVWPVTLDFGVPWDCQSDQCPKKPHPGIWEVPINQFYGQYLSEISSFKRGSMVRAAMLQNETEKSTLELLRRNFLRSYKTNKAPFMLNLNADFLNGLDGRGAIKALTQFVEETLQRPDVWYVTVRQLLEWMRQPVPHSRMASNFAPIQCKNIVIKTPLPCANANRCSYRTPDLPTGDHMFRTCMSCPRRYPWINNPEGTT